MTHIFVNADGSTRLTKETHNGAKVMTPITLTTSRYWVLVSTNPLGPQGPFCVWWEVPG